jgi:predicted transcriptional regulator of viral defense system
LNAGRRAAAQRLAALAEAGWLTRLRRGFYLVLPLEAASGSTTTVEDPWLLASALYSPCYIAGWTAAEHWGLTEQLFRSTFVATTRNIRERRPTVLGASFNLVRVKPERLSHVDTPWRGSVRIGLSGRERTLVDAAIDPRWLGGFRHLTDVFTTYTQSGKEADLLLELRRSGTGAAAKRIGFLAERLWPSAAALIRGAQEMKSTGVIKLEPSSQRRGSMNTRWGLWINIT